MSNWALLNKCRISDPRYPDSDALWGFSGIFRIHLACSNLPVRCIASDGEGWQHVSVSFGPDYTGIIPKWDVMAAVKDLFWEPEDAVIQIHPPRSTYVNKHPGCLHLWRCIDGREQPLPAPILVGKPTSR